MEYVIETKDLCKQYRTKFALRDVSMHVKKGEIYGLIGKNGAGKTTLMKLILGICKAGSGSLTLFEGEPYALARKKIGSLVEAPGLYKNCSARENMRRFAILYGADEGEIEPILERVNLAYTGKKKAGEFSLGMRQRLGIAIALLGKPEVLVLDEPINGLDPAGIKEVRDLILQLHDEGITFVISSHLLDELAKVVTQYGILADGRLVEEISAAELNEKCRRYVKIVCSDGEGALALLKERVPDLQAERRGGGLYIYSHLDQTAGMNALLVKSGFSVSELALTGGDVEEFFIERLGR